MGNRAVITTEDKKIGVYLHWNGGRDSIEAFLLYCKLQGYRAPENDCYGWARLCQVIGNFFGGTGSVGIDTYDRLDTNNWDNGVYIIKNWEIVGREFNNYPEQQSYDLLELLKVINKKMPEYEQLTIEQLEQAVETPITKNQIKAIHAIVKDMGIKDGRYRLVLHTLFNVTTCKDLTEKQASVMIEMLNKVKEVI